MALPTIQEITNLYLYGQTTRPQDLLSDALIRPANKKTHWDVDVNEYMAGPGRFVNAASFGLVNEFFTRPVAAGTYTEAQLRIELGVTEKFVSMSQWMYSDGTDDYKERAYIWNSTNIEIRDDPNLRFVVNTDGVARFCPS